MSCKVKKDVLTALKDWKISLNEFESLLSSDNVNGEAKIEKAISKYNILLIEYKEHELNGCTPECGGASKTSWWKSFINFKVS